MPEIPALELAALLPLVAALLLAAFNYRRALSLRAAAVMTGVLVLLDQSRMQPWVYEYWLLVVVLSFAGSRAPARRIEGILMTCRLILIALYFWSAIQKMNITFMTHTWPELCAGLANTTQFANVLSRAGWVAAVAELALAAALLSNRSRRIAVAAAVTMHIVIVLMLAAEGENAVVWPWNATMAALTVFLFAGNRMEGLAVVRGDGSLRHLTVVIVVGMLPVLSLFGRWDAYLSAALYSGNTLQAVVIVPRKNLSHLPPLVKNNTWQRSEPMFIDINRWSYDELNVPAYPSERVMKAVGGDICRHYSPDGILQILGRPNWLSGERTRSSYDCSALIGE